uniref:DUF551 domain-containing protein n=1 Tax=Enterobacter roggenkampii TaxID=1812935 RepID=UPI0021AD8EF5|nr:DUF551 domain-containing protein [Enterobacter roggenkampii]
MAEFTKEQLIKQAKKNIEVLRGEVEKIPGASDAAVIHLKLAEITLASLEAEAVGEVVLGEYDDCGCHPDARVACIAADCQADWENFKDGTRLYTAPPAPVSMKDHQIRELVNELRDIAVEYHGTRQLRERIARTIRDAMLQGAENAGSPTTMKTAPALDSSPKIAESTSGNSPVIPDGWVMVPVEPTEDMIVHGFESEPDESFSDEKEWEAYVTMSGCQQAAHRAKLCWAAMITAAPKPDVR